MQCIMCREGTIGREGATISFSMPAWTGESAIGSYSEMLKMYKLSAARLPWSLRADFLRPAFVYVEIARFVTSM